MVRTQKHLSRAPPNEPPGEFFILIFVICWCDKWDKALFCYRYKRAAHDTIGGCHGERTTVGHAPASDGGL